MCQIPYTRAYSLMIAYIYFFAASL